MTLRRALIDAADRGVGRHALASLSTRRARRGTELDVEILYDRAWVHRIDSTYIPVSDRFEYRRDWNSTLATIFDPIRENWLFLYEPREGDTIVDIGAGDGLDSVLLERSRPVGPRARRRGSSGHLRAPRAGLQAQRPVQRDPGAVRRDGRAWIRDHGGRRVAPRPLHGARRNERSEAHGRGAGQDARRALPRARNRAHRSAQDEHRRRRAARIARGRRDAGAHALRVHRLS